VHYNPMSPLPIQPQGIIEEQRCALLVSFAIKTLLISAAVSTIDMTSWELISSRRRLR
jgi:hypothetical protein